MGKGSGDLIGSMSLEWWLPDSKEDSPSPSSPEGKMEQGANPTPEGKTEQSANPTPEGKTEQGANPSPEGKMEQGANPTPEGKTEQGANPTPEGKMEQGAIPTPVVMWATSSATYWLPFEFHFLRGIGMAKMTSSLHPFYCSSWTPDHFN